MLLVTFLVFTINLYSSNRREKTNDSEIKGNKRYGLAFLTMISLSIGADVLSAKVNLPLWLYAVAAVAETFYFIFENTKRENDIKKRHEEMKQVLLCLAPIIKTNKDEELDLEGDYGFELSYDPKTKELCKIDCEMREVEKWENDSVLTRIVMNMNKYLSNRRWTHQMDYPNLKCVFIGSKLPPRMAKYPGSWLRPWNYIPLGVDGENELGLNLGAKEKSLGPASFKYEDGTLAKTVLPPKTPQSLIAGSTGGGKAIALDQLVTLLREVPEGEVDPQTTS